MSQPTTAAPALPFEHTYAGLPARFHQRVAPTPVSAPRWLAFNDALAGELGLGSLRESPGALAMLAGNALPDNAQPIAMAYAGHQFGHFVPQLGDGRAILLGELIDTHGQRRDLQLKGAGPTRFSRGGDGRAAIGPVLREFLVSEAMHAMGVPTTRALAAVATGDPVMRERPVPGAVLARVAASHLRVGSFQYFAAQEDADGVRVLTDYAIARHFPALAGEAKPALALLQAVAERQAALVAQWMHVGFVHGVMNTDNCAISGETIDYGPCAFLDEYDPGKVFSSIDRGGRYAFGNQAAAARWNLARLAECLLPLIDSEPEAALAQASAVINAFPDRFRAHWLAGMRRKLGLSGEEDGDEALAQALLEAMHAVAADYTLVFRGLCLAAEDREAATGDLLALPKSPGFDAWRQRWRDRLAREAQSPRARADAMRQANPAVIPRNHQVEAALVAAESGDLAPFESLLAAVRQPWHEHPDYMQAPRPDQRVARTFCGT
ncbi:protein adenylyltransferase SelO [Arenimonas sp. MALMAid1274]|uniref:protein adenylyltransferase SelO n=1 Tax=Arenimonas sp. MALMAid1274 TaxID=3411630 RepID=UPI003BA38858